MGKSKGVRFLVVLVLALTLAVPAWGEEPANEAKTDPCTGPAAEAVMFDTLIMRPIGLASMVVGLVGAIVAYPFALASGSSDRVTQKLIYEPFAFTFLRPMGDDDYNYCKE